MAHDGAACVRQLRAAGAVPVGKTTLHEFAYGATRRPLGAGRGAQSACASAHVERPAAAAAAAVAVAAGMVPLALGTDMPRGRCARARGAVRRGGLQAGLGRDLVRGRAAAGRRRSTTWGCSRATPRTWRWPMAASRRSMRRRGASGAHRLDRSFAARAHRSTHRARAVRERLGAAEGLPVDEVDLPARLPQAHELFEIFSTLQASEAFSVHAEDVAGGAGAIDAEVLQRLRRGEAIPALALCARARAARGRGARRGRPAAAARKVLALPTVPMLAPTIGERMPRIDGAAVEVRAALLSLTGPWSLVDGLPAISVPVGRVDGLPIALQLVAAAGRRPRCSACRRHPPRESPDVPYLQLDVNGRHAAIDKRRRPRLCETYAAIDERGHPAHQRRGARGGRGRRVAHGRWRADGGTRC